MRKFTFWTIILLLSSCHNSDNKETETSNQTEVEKVTKAQKKQNKKSDENESSDTVNLATKPTLDMKSVDSITLPPFEVEIQLSDKAEKKITEDDESIIISVEYFGIPKDTTIKEYIDWGKLFIGSKRYELFGTRKIKIDDIRVADEDINILKSKNLEILINVFTGRRSSNDNLLACEILHEYIDDIKNQKHILEGKLIYGE